MIKILIADDHAIVREGLKQILKDSPDMAVEGEADRGMDVLNKIKIMKYDIILLDISMPDISGLEVLKELKRQKPKLPVLMLSIHPEEQYAVRALRAGASGYLTKASAPEELLGAIRRVSQGRKYITASLAEKLASYLDTDMEKPLHEHLSDREFQVLCLIASGKTVTQIAEELTLSVKTISTYRTRILVKMKIKTNAEITRYAIENHLVN